MRSQRPPGAGYAQIERGSHADLSSGFACARVRGAHRAPLHPRQETPSLSTEIGPGQRTSRRQKSSNHAALENTPLECGVLGDPYLSVPHVPYRDGVPCGRQPNGGHQASPSLLALCRKQAQGSMVRAAQPSFIIICRGFRVSIPTVVVNRGGFAGCRSAGHRSRPPHRSSELHRRSEDREGGQRPGPDRDRAAR